MKQRQKTQTVMTRIRKAKKDVSLGDPPVQETTSGEASEQECSEQSHGEEIPDSTSNDVLRDLRESLSRSDVGSLQYRQVQHMLRDQERSIAIQKDLAEKQQESRKASLRERGVSTQTAD